MIDGPPRIGDLLLERRLVSSDQLDLALAAHARGGWRLGSVLVALGTLTADLVARVLAEQYSVHAANEQALRHVASGALGAVSRELCARFSVLPLHLDQATLHLAMRDPARLDIIGQLGRALGLSIQPYAVAEVRLFAALERHYRLPKPAQYTRPLTGPMPSAVRLPARASQPTGPPAPAARGRQESAPTGAVPAGDADGADDELQLVFLDEVSHGDVQRRQTGRPGDNLDELHIDIDIADIDVDVELRESTFDIEIDLDLPIDDAPGTAGPARLEEVLAELRQATDRESVLMQLLRPVFAQVSLAVVFRPRGHLALALGAWGTALPADKVRQLKLPLQTASLLQRAYSERLVLGGPASDDALQPMIATYLDVAAPDEAWVVPVCIKDRVVNLLCVQCSAPLQDNAAEQLAQLAQHAAAAYTRAILSRRS